MARMTLAQFNQTQPPSEVTSTLLRKLNGGTFQRCHRLVYAETGMWIDDLVPVFQKLDAFLMVQDLPRELQ